MFRCCHNSFLLSAFAGLWTSSLLKTFVLFKFINSSPTRHSYVRATGADLQGALQLYPPTFLSFVPKHCVSSLCRDDDIFQIMCIVYVSVPGFLPSLVRGEARNSMKIIILNGNNTNKVKKKDIIGLDDMRSSGADEGWATGS